MTSLAEMKEHVGAIERKIVAAKGEGYLKALYQREGVSKFSEGSLDHFKAQVAALTVEAARMDGEHAAESAIATGGLPADDAPVCGSPLQKPARAAMPALSSTPDEYGKQCAAALAQFESLSIKNTHAANEFWEKNSEMMKDATGWADRAASRKQADATYALLVNLGRSYEAGRFWQRNRDLLMY